MFKIKARGEKMIKVYPMVLGPVQTMCYVVSEGELAVVVDPADQGRKIYDYLRSKKLKLQAILLTHGHFDHIGGVNELTSLIDVPVYAHQAEQEYFDKPEVNLSTMMHQRLTLIDSVNVTYLGDKQEVTLLDQVVCALHVPGHTSGSLCYYFTVDDVVFTGDTLFAGAVGRSDFIHGNHEQLVRGIKGKLLTLPSNTLVYPGHENCTTIEIEAKTNPFLK